MGESLVYSHKSQTSHPASALFCYMFFSEKHIQLLSVVYCG